MIRNDNPDKGTETLLWLSLSCGWYIRNDNPDKGTETDTPPYLYFVQLTIRNDNPDKGTETIPSVRNTHTPVLY